MVNLTVVLTAKSDTSVDQIRGLLRKQATMSLTEPGCERFEVFESETVFGTFILIERWASEAALEDHRKAEGFTTVYQPLVLPLVERVAHICTPLN